ncbi:MAG TPA: PQQ-dependent sugar dehydrogenase [Luteolibacter sp.]
MLPKIPLLVWFAASASLHAGIGVQQVAKGFERPVWIGQPKGIDGKLWVIEQAGRVWVIDAKTGARSERPFLDLVFDVSRTGNEEGLLGLAFAPDFQKTGRFYVNYTDRTPQRAVTRIARFTANPATLETDPATKEVLISIEQPYRNHNGGWIGFGPDGKLYTGLGDGGAANDPQGNGQNLGSYLGKILRIDVSGEKGYQAPADNPFVKQAGALPEIWSWGMRNPWRCSFDRETGDFWVGDVGQNAWEEIDFMPKGEASGANFGWRLREGEVATRDVGGDKPPKAIDPVYVYKHGMSGREGLSVTGGYVYRGPVKELGGRYVFGDYQNPRIWSFVLRGGKASDLKDHTSELQPQDAKVKLISSFGEDNAGNLYIVDHTGPIYRVIEK